MRLIDADLLRAEFTGNFHEMWHYTGIWAMIDCAPTAYDIDKVVEQLKDHAIEFEAFGICSDYVELTHAIEMVKGGGTDG